ncbi:MAG: ornithine cyclodeaminase [Lachnospiraceae bacterium]|nr:ornithine cyclodeaminase [Lachnospiraceae bacterium]MBP5413711.1 ornithine cyclodeaminase [Lachnospiraceae bacterium]
MSYPAIDFLFLSEEDMIKAGVKDMVSCIEAMEEVVKCLNLGDYVMGGENHNSHGSQVSFPKSSPFTNMPLDEGDDRRFMAMPAYIGGPFDLMGMKWYGSNMANKEKGLPRSILTVMLNDKDTGAPLALMSANLLSAYRTGAIPGVGAKYLVRKDAKVCGICGPGVMGKTSLAAIMAACPNIDTVKVKGRGKASLMSFIEYVGKEYPKLKEVKAVETVEELIRDTDVISFANSGSTDPSTYPFVKKEWIKPGAVLIGVSAFDMDSNELKTCSLVVDNIKLYEAWAEEFTYPSFGANNIIGSKFTDMAHEGLIDMEDITDLGDIIFGKRPGRTSNDQIFVYSVGGMPVEDVAWGKVCYENAKKLGLGTKLRLWNEPDMH